MAQLLLGAAQIQLRNMDAVSFRTVQVDSLRQCIVMMAAFTQRCRIVCHPDSMRFVSISSDFSVCFVWTLWGTDTEHVEAYTCRREQSFVIDLRVLIQVLAAHVTALDVCIHKGKLECRLFSNAGPSEETVIVIPTLHDVDDTAARHLVEMGRSEFANTATVRAQDMEYALRFVGSCGVKFVSLAGVEGQPRLAIRANLGMDEDMYSAYSATPTLGSAVSKIRVLAGQPGPVEIVLPATQLNKVARFLQPIAGVMHGSGPRRARVLHLDWEEGQPLRVKTQIGNIGVLCVWIAETRIEEVVASMDRRRYVTDS